MPKIEVRAVSVENGHGGFMGLGTFAYLIDQRFLKYIADFNRCMGTNGLRPRPTHGGKGLYPGENFD